MGHDYVAFGQQVLRERKRVGGELRTEITTGYSLRPKPR